MVIFFLFCSDWPWWCFQLLPSFPTDDPWQQVLHISPGTEVPVRDLPAFLQAATSFHFPPIWDSHCPPQDSKVTSSLDNVFCVEVMETTFICLSYINSIWLKIKKSFGKSINMTVLWYDYFISCFFSLPSSSTTLLPNSIHYIILLYFSTYSW